MEHYSSVFSPAHSTTRTTGPSTDINMNEPHPCTGPTTQRLHLVDPCGVRRRIQGRNPSVETTAR
ncbi:hypothetical protein BJX96DRAFT_140465 [Aspergillus floccosus]